ncbi:MAG: UDP-N-acetylmuramate--L-alanine ligase [Phycisphaerae bacterium]
MDSVSLLRPVSGMSTHATARDFRGLNVHMIGIGGSGMAGLAAVLLRCGARVSGSDCAPSGALARLQSSGAKISTRQDADALPLDAELVVASAAIPASHPELVEARRRGIEVHKYAQLLGALLAQRDGIAISGTHGKSTTTAWTAFVLRQAGLDPCFVVGADCEQLGGGSGVGDGKHFVAEACEYDRSFLNLRPKLAAILNIEEDHLDCYADLEEIAEAFRQFAQTVPNDGLLVLNGADERCRQIAATVGRPFEFFGFADTDTWQARDAELHDGCHRFTVAYRGAALGRIQLQIPGRHNVLNALAVCALTRRAGVPWPALADILPRFHGARRRLELRGEEAGILVADDYAHHPTEIRATLAAARERFSPRRVWCVFQPHQHSRTRFLLEDFADSFDLADHVIVPDIYFVRDTQRDQEAVCAADLVDRICSRGGDARYVADFSAIVEHLSQRVESGDLVLTMGAGSIWKVADELLRALRGNPAD